MGLCERRTSPRRGTTGDAFLPKVKVDQRNEMRPTMPAVELELEFDAETELVRIWRTEELEEWPFAHASSSLVGRVK